VRVTIAAIAVSCLLLVVVYGAPVAPVAVGAGAAWAWTRWGQRRQRAGG
jgi:hypothetical protein